MLAFKRCTVAVEECLQKVLVKVYSVDSEVFKNYKFKEVVGLFEEACVELHKVNFLEMLPSFCK